MNLRTKLKKFLTILSGIAISFGMCGESAYAINNEKEITKQSVEAFSDPLFETNMEKYTIPGGVLTIVKDGKILLSKGYGYAELQTKNEVQADKTLFRIGSVTKLFTATAAMQLVGEGKIAIDEPVNEYIKGFKVPQDYETPVTLKHLLTHTSGLDDTVIGDLAKEESGIKNLTEFYADYNWKSVREPGTIIQYNNRGMGLAGALIEQVSGVSCKAYIEKNIFEPLKMGHTSLKLYEDGLSKGYVYNKFTKQIGEEKLEGYFNVYPVGGIISTGEDMAHFMMAHLNEGRFEGNTLLIPEMTKEMQARQVGFNEYLPGNTYGFHELFLNDRRIIEHSGYSPDGFLTELALIPEENMGIFISVNQGSNNTFPQDYLQLFVKNYFTHSYQQEIKSPVDKKSAKQVEGIYRSSDYSRADLCKGDILGMGKDVIVKSNKDGSITVTESMTNYFDLKTTTVSWKGIEIAPYTYQNTEKNEYIAFKEDAKGKVSYMSKTADSSIAAYERIKWYDRNAFQISLIIVLLLLGSIEVLIGLIRLLIRSIKCILKKEQKPLVLEWGQPLAGAITLLNVGFYVISMYTWGGRMHYGVPLDVKLELTMLIIAAALTPLLIVLSIDYWKNKRGSVWMRLNISLMTLVAIAFVWFNQYWNFLGFNF